jgi:hypothetical protein
MRRRRGTPWGAGRVLLAAAWWLLGGTGLASDASCSAIGVQAPILWTAAGTSVEAWDLRFSRRARLSVSPLPGAPRGILPFAGESAVALCGDGGAFILSKDASPPRWLGAPAPVLGASQRNGLLAVACGHRGVYFYSVTNPAAPMLLGVFSAATDARATGFVASLVCVADGTNGLRFLDLSTPARPELVGVFLPPGNAPVDALGISTTLIVTAHGRQLRLLDASDPRHPVVTATCELPDSARGLAVTRMRVWAACGTAGLVELDLAHGLKELSRHPTTGSALAVAAEGSRVFVAEGEAGWRELELAR